MKLGTDAGQQSAPRSAKLSCAAHVPNPASRASSTKALGGEGSVSGARSKEYEGKAHHGMQMEPGQGAGQQSGQKPSQPLANAVNNSTPQPAARQASLPRPLKTKDSAGFPLLFIFQSVTACIC